MAKALGGPMQVAPLVGIWVGIGRDQAATLPAVLSSIAASSTLLFRGGSCVIIYENDSSDGTADVVRAWEQSLEAKACGCRRVVMLSERLGLGVKRPSHSFLAKCRNKYLEAVEALVAEEAWLRSSLDRARVVAVDLDLRLGFPAPSLATSLQLLEALPSVGAVASNGVFTPQGHMYDAFAFRCGDAFATAPLAYDPAVFGGLACFWAALNGDRDRRPAFPPTLPPRRVDCAFGGMCAYRYAALEGLRHDDESEDCEHVSLCAEIRRRGSDVLFNPAALLWNADYDDPRTLLGGRVDAWATFDDPAGRHLGVADDASHTDGAEGDDGFVLGPPSSLAGFEVVVQYYAPADAKRAAEIDACAKRNVASRNVARVHFLVEDATAAERLRAAVGPPSGRVDVVVGAGRLSFGAAFGYGDAVAPPGAVVAVVNADICLDHPTCLRMAHRALRGRRHRVLALTRHEASPFGPQLFGGGARPDAQDAWLFVAPLDLGHARPMLDAVQVGRGGADNRVALHLLLSGVDVTNPARSVVLHHVQAKEKRGWQIAEVPPPYAYLPPATIEASRHPQFAPMACLDDGRSRGHATLRVGDCACRGCGRLRALLLEWQRLGLAKLRRLKTAGPCTARWRERAVTGEPMRTSPLGDVRFLVADHAHDPLKGGDDAPACATLLLRSLGDAGPDAPSLAPLRWATAASDRPRDLAAAVRVRGHAPPKSSTLLLDADPTLDALALARVALLNYDQRHAVPELLALGTVPVFSTLDADMRAKLVAAGLHDGTHYLLAAAYDPDDDATLAALARNGKAWYEANAAPFTAFKRAVALARLATSPPPAKPPCLDSE